MRKGLIFATLGVQLFIPIHSGRADQFHYNNLLIGDRAIGLGGAYGGVSDDASGVYYNPAGLAFALSNDVSGSANALNKKTLTYKKTIAGEDFVERSGGTYPSFFGGLQKLDHVAKGLVAAFGIYTTDGELKEQDDLFTHKTLNPPTPCALKNADNTDQKDEDGQVLRGAARPPTVLDRFHRSVNQKASTGYAGAAAAYRLASNVALGFGLNYVTTEELVQEYQDIRTQVSVCKNTGDFTEFTEQKGQNIRQYVIGYGVQPVLGIQAALGGTLSLGLTLKTGVFAAQSFHQRSEARTADLVPEDQASVDASPTGSAQTASSALIGQSKNELKSDKPLGTMPLEIRLGSAWFYSTRLLLTFDITRWGAVTDEGDIPGAGKLYEKQATTNYASGLEYYVTPSMPLRLGVFTNNDARPKIEKNKTGQRDHIDYTGESVFVTYVQPNSQIGGGVVLQQGSGEAQKIGGVSTIQTVAARSYTFAFSVTHSF